MGSRRMESMFDAVACHVTMVQTMATVSHGNVKPAPASALIRPRQGHGRTLLSVLPEATERPTPTLHIEEVRGADQPLDVAPTTDIDTNAEITRRIHNDVRVEKRRRVDVNPQPLDEGADADNEWGHILADVTDPTITTNDEPDRRTLTPPVNRYACGHESEIDDDLPSSIHVPGDDEHYVPARHPAERAIERRLGPKCEMDSWCYLSEILANTDYESRPREVNTLIAKVDEYNYSIRDKVEAAMRIRALYEDTIRQPANRKQSSEVLPDWTLRSVYRYMTQKANSSGHLFEDMMTRLHRAFCVIDSRMYRAPACQVTNDTVRLDDLRVDKTDLQCLLGLTSKLLQVAGSRERLRSNDCGMDGRRQTGAGTSSGAGIRSRSGVSGSIGRGGRGEPISGLGGRTAASFDDATFTTADQLLQQSAYRHHV
jgi:hypothetical protein